MDALTSFLVVIIAITIQFSLYAIKRLQEPLEPNYLIHKNSKKISMNSYFFFGFHIFKDFTVTFMCQRHPMPSLN